MSIKAVIMEFKVFNPRKESTLHDTVNHALQQIHDKKYDTELIAKGIAKEKERFLDYS